MWVIPGQQLDPDLLEKIQVGDTVGLVVIVVVYFILSSLLDLAFFS